jgi:hypothetical protein
MQSFQQTKQIGPKTAALLEKIKQNKENKKKPIKSFKNVELNKQELEKQELEKQELEKQELEKDDEKDAICIFQNVELTSEAKKILSDFTNWANMNDDPQAIFDYITNAELNSQFFEIVNSKLIVDKMQTVFEFSYKHGILAIVKYLYEVKNISYDQNILSGNTITLSSANNSNAMLNLAESGSSENTKACFHIEDKFTEQRKICAQYLMDMRPYSEYKYKNGKHFYTLKKNKYRHLFP